ncbi:MAG: aldehyde dehydrogenase family protein [Bacteroidia bacterium]
MFATDSLDTQWKIIKNYLDDNKRKKKHHLRTPFGGVKNSGVGREGGFHALNFFTEPQNVCIGV